MIRPNHIALSDVKFLGPEHLHVSVQFQTDEEIDALIGILEGLKKSSDDFAHCHLQDSSLVNGPTRKSAAEVCFYGPGVLEIPAEVERRHESIEAYEAYRTST